MYLSMAGVGRIVVAVESPQSYNFSGNLSCCRCCRHRRQSGHRTRLTLQNRYRLAVARRCLYPHPAADAPFPPIWKAVKPAFIPACGRSSAMRPSRLQSRQLGCSPLSTYVAQGTSALTATRRRDCGRRSRPQTRSTSRTIGPPAASVCSRPAPCQRTDARTSRA